MAASKWDYGAKARGRVRLGNPGGGGHGMSASGAGIRPVPETVTMTVIPWRCLCTWSPVTREPRGWPAIGWRLKFRHAACPAKTSGEHA